MKIRTALAFSALALAPAAAQACACGCGMFTVGMPGMALPTNSGGSVNLQEIFLDQNQAMQGSSKIPLSQSPDQRIDTKMFDLTAMYQFNRDWGMMAMIPYWQRSFDTNANFGNGAPQIVNSRVNTLSDIELMGMYTGFSPDMSKGLIFGLKLPTGTYTAAGFDRDTQPGTGSTDALLGGFVQGQERKWGWFTQAIYKVAMSTRDDYRPGNELQAVAGLHYDGYRRSSHLIPLLQLNATIRNEDTGINSSTPNSGLRTVYLTPGVLVEITRHWQANATLYLPLYQHVNGIQLVPKEIASVGITYNL
ncbi:MAG TPA: hypothetical protein PLK99_01235 [Burkholderiales bacterium]|nr:hypothetical protein [Burkholderiales bacterium]